MATLKIPITQHDHIRGPAHAPITLVEYGDYECPHCALAGLFWDMHDALFQNQSRLSVTTIFLIGEELGLPETALRGMPLRRASTEITYTATLWAAYAAA